MIQLKRYNHDTREEEILSCVDIRSLANALAEPEVFAQVLTGLANSFSAGQRRGREVGRELHSAHRTLQRNIVAEVLGILEGLAEQKHTDARNETAIETCRKIAEMELGAGQTFEGGSTCSRRPSLRREL